MTRKEMVKIMNTAETGNDMLALAERLATLVASEEDINFEQQAD